VSLHGRHDSWDNRQHLHASNWKCSRLKKVVMVFGDPALFRKEFVGVLVRSNWRSSLYVS
jgi:hypothetical protein